MQTLLQVRIIVTHVRWYLSSFEMYKKKPFFIFWFGLRGRPNQTFFVLHKALHWRFKLFTDTDTFADGHAASPAQRILYLSSS